jgi:hypothetical protein
METPSSQNPEEEREPGSGSPEETPMEPSFDVPTEAKDQAPEEPAVEAPEEVAEPEESLVDTTSPEAEHSIPEPAPDEEPLLEPAGFPEPEQPPESDFPPASHLPPYPPFPGQPVSPDRSPKDRVVALVLEILPGLIGFLGFGWIYAGNMTVGLILLISFLIWNILAVVLSIITLSIFLCLYIPVNITVISLSAIFLYNYTKQHPEHFPG